MVSIWCRVDFMKTSTVRLTLRLPTQVHAALEQRAAQEYRSLNNEIVLLLVKVLNDQSAEQPQAPDQHLP